MYNPRVPVCRNAHNKDTCKATKSGFCRKMAWAKGQGTGQLDDYNIIPSR